MIKKSVFEDELIAGMQRELTANEQSAAVNNLDKAVECLHSAVEVFEEAGMKTQADAVLNILLKIAQRHGKKPKKDKHTAGLTSERMIQNLLNHGTEFNMSDDETINDLLADDMENPESFDNSDVDDLLNTDFGIDDLAVSDEDAFSEMDFEDEV